MIYTSYFSNLQQILGLKPDICLCPIAGNTPIWFTDVVDKLKLKSFKCLELAPKIEWWKEWHDKFKDNRESAESKAWYEDKYMSTVLDKLDARDIVDKLYECSENNDICLLCYEKPGSFCHRHIVSRWLNSNGIACKEL